MQKIQGTYFKISALYFKIYGLYFWRFQIPEKQQLEKSLFLRQIKEKQRRGKADILTFPRRGYYMFCSKTQTGITLTYEIILCAALLTIYIS